MGEKDSSGQEEKPESNQIDWATLIYAILSHEKIGPAIGKVIEMHFESQSKETITRAELEKKLGYGSLLVAIIAIVSISILGYYKIFSSDALAFLFGSVLGYVFGIMKSHIESLRRRT